MDDDPLQYLRAEKLSFEVQEEDAEEVETKTLLTDASIETKRSGVTVGLYCDGTLADKAYSTSFSGIVFNLAYDKTYTLYALANMGDLRGSLPASESSLSSFVYSIPAYTGLSNSVNTLGIPMAGKLDYTCGTSTVTAIPVKRLLAKVTASLSCDWAGAKIKSAKVYNMNGKLKPFGSSAASGSSDMLSFQELESASGAGTTSLIATFYVPENMQGTVSGISSSSNKAGDKNATVGSNADKLTYLEVEVESEGKYDGAVKYRSYLGNNATTNFDIARNASYVWTIHYQSDVVDDYNDDWKHDLDGMEIIDYSLSLDPATKSITPGENFSYTTTLNRNVIKPTPSTTSTPLTNGDASWSSSNTSVATVNSSGVVTGVASGTANITARYTPTGSDFSERTATASVTVSSVTYALEVEGSPLEVDYMSPINLTAKYYTITDGVKNAGEVVTTNSELSWTRFSGSDKVAVGLHTGVVTATDYGEAVIRASYKGIDTDTNVKFNRTDKFLDLTATPTTQVAGSNVQLAASLRTVTNGVATSVPVAAGSVTWSVQEKSVAGAVVTVSSAGVVTSDRATTVKIKGVSGGVEGYVDIVFMALTSKYIQISGSPLTKNVGETIALSAKLFTVTDGTPDSGTTITPTWSRKSGSANISVSSTGVVSATDYGTAVIQAKYNPGSGELTDEVTVTFNKETHALVIAPAAPAAVNVGSTINLTATYYTYFNGSETGSVNVSVASGTTWSRGDSKVTVTKGATYAQVTASAGVTTSVTASYAGESASVNVTFNDVISHSLEITASPASGNVNVGETITLTAKYYTTTNGVKNAGTVVTPTWSVVAGSPNVSVTSAGVVSAVSGGNGTIQASYTTGGNTYTETISVSFGNVDVEKYRLVITPTSSEINWNATQSYTIYRYTDVYRNGSLYTSGTVATPMSSSDFNWSSSSTSIATVSSGVATGVSGGTVTITAFLKSSVAEYSKYNNTSVTSSLKVNNVVTYSVEITSSPASGNASVGETIILTAKLFTTTNGVKNAGTDVTSSASWSRASGSANITVGNSGSNKGKVTATAAGTAVAKVEYTYSGNTYSATTSVSFGDVVVEKYRIEVSPSSATIAWDADKQLKVVRYTDTYRNGVIETAGTTGTDMAASNFNWTSSASGKASVNASGLVHGEGTGSATITATLKSSVTDYAKYDNTTASAAITVTEVKSYRLVLSADSVSKPYNGTISLTAKYYTTTNGVEDAGVNVTPSSLTKTSGGSNITLTAGNPSTAKLTNSALSVVANNKATVTATYSGVTSNAVSIEFTNVTTSTYTRLVVTGDSSVNVGSVTGNYTATLYTQAYVNGVASGSATTSDVSSSATFASSNTGIATISGRKATGVAAGTTYISASYTGTYGSVSTANADRAQLTVSNVDVNHYRLEIVPASAEINWNATQSYTVNRYTDVWRNGSLLTSGTTPTAMSASDFTWSSSATGVATVSASGVATGVNGGTTTITATLKSSVANYSMYDTKTVTSSLKVNNVVSYSLEITSSPASATANVGETITLTAKYYTTTNGVKNSGTNVTATWSRKSGSANVSVNASGAVTATAGGTAVIQASYTTGGNTYTATKEVTFGNVDVEKYRIVITPSTATIAWNTTQAYTVNRYTDIYRNGSLLTTGTTPTAMAASNFTWTSSATGVATVNASGVATGVNGGTSTIKAALKSSVTDYAKYANTEVTSSLTVTNVTSYAYTRLVISGDSEVYVGASTGNYTATLYTQTYVNGVASGAASTSDVSGSVTFSSSDTGKATISGRKATGVAAGTTYISGSYSGTYGTVTTATADRKQLTVKANVITHRLVVTPSAPSAMKGETISLVATYYTTTNGVEDAGVVVTTDSGTSWSRSSGSSNVSVNNSSTNKGKVTATSYGTAVIQASYNGYTGTATVSFSAYVFKLNPATSDGYELGVGYDKTFKVYRYLASGSGSLSGETLMGNSNFTWSSNATGRATVGSDGKVHGVANGAVTITATLRSTATDYAKFGNTTDTCSITVVSGGSTWDDDWEDGGEIGLD